MKTPSRETLSSILYSAILTSALFPAAGPTQLAAMGSPAVQAAVQNAMAGLRAHGAAGVDSIPAPDPVATPVAMIAPQAAQDPILTKANRDKILNFVAQGNTVSNLFPIACTPLELCHSNGVWPATGRGRALADGPTIIARVSSAGDDDIVIQVRAREGDKASLYRIHRDGTCVKAVWFKMPNPVPPGNIIDNATAQAEVKVALDQMVASIDRIDAPTQTAGNP